MRFRHPYSHWSLQRLAAIVLCAACLLLWGLAGNGQPAFAAENTANEKKFEELVKEFKKLIETPREASRRASWLRMEDAFLALRRANPKAGLAAKAYYQSGRCLEEMARNTRKSEDARDAAARFAAVADGYPRHSWADDALYRKAIVELELLDDKRQAADTLDDLVRRFPSGDMVARAKTLRRSLPVKPAAQAPAEKERGRTEESGGGTLLRTTLEARANQSVAYVELDRGSSYFYRYLPGNAQKKQPPVFLIEFFGVRPDRKNRRAVAVSKGPVDRIWTRDVSTGKRFVTRLEFELDKECAVSLKPRKDKPVLQVTVSRGSAVKSQTRGTGQVGPEAPELKPGGESAPRPSLTSNRSSGKEKAQGKKQHSREKEPARKPNPAKSRDLAEQLGLTVKTIMLDAGHGGKDPGAMANGVVEGDLVLKTVKLLGANLKKRGFTVLYTRSKDTFLKLEERTRIANRRGADIFVSIHVNANHDAGVRGIETYYLDVAYTANAKRVAARENAVSEKTISDLQGILTDLLLSSKMHESKELAGLVLNNMCARLGRAGYKSKNNGVRSAPFYVLMGAKMPSILVEIGYCTNPAEAKLLKNTRYLEFLVDGIAEGIVRYKRALGRYAMN